MTTAAFASAPRPSVASPATSSKSSPFDWAALFKEAGLRDSRALELHQAFVQKHLDENWLESVNREVLKNAGNLSDAECLMVMQIITKRRLKRLEQIGHEKVLQSIKNTHSVGALSSKLSAPLLPTPAARSPHAANQMMPLAPMVASRPPTSSVQPVQQHVQPSSNQRSVRDIPSLQPQNSVTSVKMPIQPVMKEFTTSSFIPVADSPYMAQQSTTTQYMAARSSSSANDVAPSSYLPSTVAPQLPYGVAAGIPPNFMASAIPPAYPAHQFPQASSYQNSFSQPPPLTIRPSYNSGTTNGMPIVLPMQQQYLAMPPLQPQQTQGPMRSKYADPMGMSGNGAPQSNFPHSAVPQSQQQQPFLTSVPPAFLNPAMVPPTTTFYARGNQTSDSNDKYAIFKHVDPRSPSFIGAPPPPPPPQPQPQPQPQAPHQNFPHQPPPQHENQQAGQIPYYGNVPNYQATQWRPGPSY